MIMAVEGLKKRTNGKSSLALLFQRRELTAKQISRAARNDMLRPFDKLRVNGFGFGCWRMHRVVAKNHISAHNVCRRTNGRRVAADIRNRSNIIGRQNTKPVSSATKIRASLIKRSLFQFRLTLILFNMHRGSLARVPGYGTRRCATLFRKTNRHVLPQNAFCCSSMLSVGRSSAE